MSPLNFQKSIFASARAPVSWWMLEITGMAGAYQPECDNQWLILHPGLSRIWNERLFYLTWNPQLPQMVVHWSFRYKALWRFQVDPKEMPCPLVRRPLSTTPTIGPSQCRFQTSLVLKRSTRYMPGSSYCCCTAGCPCSAVHINPMHGSPWDHRDWSCIV